MRRLLLAAGSIALGLGAFLLLRPSAPQPVGTIESGDRLFDAVFARIRASLVEPLDDADLYRRAALGLIGELDDPYAYLQLPGQPAPFPADQPFPQGVFLDRRDGRAVVVSTVPGSAAEEAGVLPGDILAGIDTAVITANRLDAAARLLSGRPGTTVTLRLRRGDSALSSVVRRGPVPAPAATHVVDLGGGVASIRLSRVGPGIADTVRRAIEELRSQGVKSLMLDLRGTAQGGSDLASGTAMADLFLDRGAVLAVSRMRRASGMDNVTDTAPSPFAGMPLAVLIDAGTAGAAEVLAGALQDHDRAIVLGQESYGRGATWSRFSLGNGAVLTLTTALWLTPSGRVIQRLPASDDGAPEDSVARPTTRSDGGRVLMGGGGIVPDRVIPRGSGDLVLAEARRILMRATSPRTVFALAPPN